MIFFSRIKLEVRKQKEEHLQTPVNKAAYFWKSSGESKEILKGNRKIFLYTEQN